MGHFFIPRASKKRVAPKAIPAVKKGRPKKPAPHVSQLSAHPNWEMPQPEPQEDVIAYTLRCAALLISPPKIEGEDEDTSCEVVANAVKRLAEEVRRVWTETGKPGATP